MAAEGIGVDGTGEGGIGTPTNIENMNAYQYPRTDPFTLVNTSYIAFR